jgi:hypothetical protein
MYPKSEHCEQPGHSGRAITGRPQVACAFSALAFAIAFGLSIVVPPSDGGSITAAMSATTAFDAADYEPAPAQRRTP